MSEAPQYRYDESTYLPSGGDICLMRYSWDTGEISIKIGKDFIDNRVLMDGRTITESRIDDACQFVRESLNKFIESKKP